MIRRVFFSILFGAVVSISAVAQSRINIEVTGENRFNVPVYRVAITSDSFDNDNVFAPSYIFSSVIFYTAKMVRYKWDMGELCSV